MFRKSSIVFAFFAAAFITGCFGSQPTWRKEGVSAEDAHSALAKCKYEVGLNKIPKESQQELIENCMEGQGFRSR
ncbi:MAG: hypothetical protein FWH15_09615 [Betaproteobacteria bacterium]|nr:hypothetical protein [Betaproteobacteria bacterium]